MKPGVRDSIGDLFHSVAYYCSNLIDGHNTHPRDIDSALHHERYSDDLEKHALQQEAMAHIEMRRTIEAREALDTPRETMFAISTIRCVT